MKKKFAHIIKNELALLAEDVILVALSGGRDSVCLCELLKQCEQNFAIAHCNFSLRGEESDGDEEFVRKLAKKYNVPCHIRRFDTEKVAKASSMSIQETARQLRYEWFEDIREKEGYSKIATGHHLDDSIETVLFHLIRGTGISGLHGIPMENASVIRPLLFASRDEISAFVKENDLAYREDSSNQSEKYARNKIRHQLVPVLAELNTSFHQSFHQTIKKLQSTERVYKKQIENEKQRLWRKESFGIHISIEALLALDDLATYLYEWFKDYGFSSVDDILKSLNGPSGKIFLSKTHRIVRDRQDLILTELPEAPKEYFIEEETSSIDLPIGLLFAKESQDTKNERAIARFTIGKLGFPLTLRTWRKGDVFYPDGMRGKKKLSDYYTDCKLSIPEKENTWLLCSGDQIIWVVGHRMDRRFKLGDTREKAYIVSIKSFL